MNGIKIYPYNGILFNHKMKYDTFYVMEESELLQALFVKEAIYKMLRVIQKMQCEHIQKMQIRWRKEKNGYWC